MIILTVLILLVGLVLIFSFGFKLSLIIQPKSERLEHLSLSYILGIGIFTLLWFLMNWAGIPYNLLSGFVLLFGLNALVFLVYRVKFGKWFEKSRFDFKYFYKLTIPEKIGLGILNFICVSVLAQCLYWPVHVWDSLVLYDFRAEVFVQTGFMQAAIERGYFFSYPLLTSLAHTWAYLLKGISPNFLYALWFIAFLVNFFVNLKKLNLNRFLIIFLTLAVAVSPRLFDHTQWAYTNLPYTVYLCLGYIYLYFSLKDKSFGSYIISAVLIGLSNWTRTLDPFWITAIIAGVVFPLIFRKKLWPIAYVAIIGTLMLPWRLFQSSHNQGVADLNLQSINLSLLKPAFDFFLENVIHMYLIYFVLLGIIIFIKFYIRSKKWLFTGIVLFDLLIVFGGTIALASNTVYWQDIPDSLARMVLFIPVLIIFLFAELLQEIKKNRIKKSLL